MKDPEREWERGGKERRPERQQRDIEARQRERERERARERERERERRGGKENSELG